MQISSSQVFFGLLDGPTALASFTLLDFLLDMYITVPPSHAYTAGTDVVALIGKKLVVIHTYTAEFTLI